MTHEEAYGYMLSMRGLDATPTEHICKKCSGSGVVAYGSTATWHYGPGGSMITSDVCDSCWGSGSSIDRWPSHREFYRMKKILDKQTTK